MLKVTNINTKLKLEKGQSYDFTEILDNCNSVDSRLCLTALQICGYNEHYSSFDSKIIEIFEDDELVTTAQLLSYGLEIILLDIDESGCYSHLEKYIPQIKKLICKYKKILNA